MKSDQVKVRAFVFLLAQGSDWSSCKRLMSKSILAGTAFCLLLTGIILDKIRAASYLLLEKKMDMFEV